MMALSARWQARCEWGRTSIRGRGDGGAEEGHPSHATGGTCSRTRRGEDMAATSNKPGGCRLCGKRRSGTALTSARGAVQVLSPLRQRGRPKIW